MEAKREEQVKRNQLEQASMHLSTLMRRGKIEMKSNMQHNMEGMTKEDVRKAARHEL